MAENSSATLYYNYYYFPSGMITC